MAVKVKLKSGATETIEAGVTFEVTDGHLLVKGQIPKYTSLYPVGAFSPGFWVRAEVDLPAKTTS